MNNTQTLTISASEMFGAINDGQPSSGYFGPALELNENEYSLATSFRMPSDWNGGPVRVRVNHYRFDTSYVDAFVVLNIMASGIHDNVSDQGTSAALDLSGNVGKLTGSPSVLAPINGTFTGSEFVGLYMTVEEPADGFRCNVRSIDIQYTRGICEDAWSE